MSKKPLKAKAFPTTLRKAFGKPKKRDAVLAEIRKNTSVFSQFNSFSPEDQERIIKFLSGEATLQILYDKFFKKVMDPEVDPERVESFISALYGQKVRIVSVPPREGCMITDEGSQVIMDILVILEDGSFINIEMQRLGYLFPGERSSCYIADLLMRQYGKVRAEKGKKFSYHDMKPVNLIVIMEQSTKEFRDVSPEYIHRRYTSYSSGADVKSLENITYISLDTFKKKAENKISSSLDAWLTFFTAEKPEEVLKLIGQYPEFLPMYQDISEFRKNPEEVIGMFSEALRIMDRNTTKYMIDDLHSQLDSLLQEKKEAEEDLTRAKKDKAKAEEDKAKAEEDRARAEEDRARAEEDRARAEEDRARAEEDKARAEEDRARAEEDKARAEEDKVRLEAELAKYKAKYGEIA